jgi:HK97 family phage portal protein
MSIRSRIAQAGKALLGRSVEMPFEQSFSGQGLPPSFKSRESLEAYGDNPWLAGAVDKIAREIANTKFRLQRENADGEIEFIKSHQAIETLKRPQPTKGGKTMLTNFQLKLVTGYHLCLVGEAFWLLDDRMSDRLGGAPRRIDILRPDMINPVIKGGEITHYVYNIGTSQMEFPPEDIVHFKLPDPIRWQRGQPPTKAIRFSLDTHQEADVMNLAKIRNGAVPGGTLETDQDIPEATRIKLRDAWNQRHRGAGNAGKVDVLPKGLHLNKTQESNADMQYVEGKQTNMTEILARLGVPKEVLGLTESQTRANAEAAFYAFMKFGALFFIECVKDGLDNEYLPAFPGVEDAYWGYPDPVPENMEEKRANAKALWDMGALTPNEALKMFGMEPRDIPAMDTTYLDMGKMPIDAEPPDLSLAA